MDLNTPIWQLTAGQFLDLTGNKPTPDIKDFSEPKKYVYGLSGLRELLHVSHPTAQRIKDSGKIPFIQTGRKLIFDAEAVLKALENKKGGFQK